MTPDLPVNELFDTIQGEATWAGTHSTFVRLQGCAVGCPWCDTKHTWELDPRAERTFLEVRFKDKDAATYALVRVPDLIGELKHRHARHVVITGGEPCAHDLSAVTAAIAAMGARAQIETSGTSAIRADASAWVTLSPKLDMPGGLTVLPDSVQRADEIKMPVGKRADVDKLLAFLQAHRSNRLRQIPVWLQPLSMSRAATAVCVEACAQHGWRLSVQTHKFIGLR